MPECSLAETIQGLDRLRSGAAGLMVGSLSDVVPLSIESMYVAVSTNTCLHARWHCKLVASCAGHSEWPRGRSPCAIVELE